MIHYRDMTFCCALHHKPECDRQFTDEDAANAEKWWGDKGAPVAWRNFCGGPDRWTTDGSDNGN